MWWNKKLALSGSVYYPGNFPLRAQDFNHLKQKGYELFEEDPKEERWAIRLEHETLGSALLVGFVEHVCPPDIIIEQSYLLEEEKQSAVDSRSGASLRLEVTNNDILKDRKLLLTWLSDLLGGHGVFAVDHTSQLIWSAAALADEMKHGADVDVGALYTLHAVSSEDNEEVIWLHSHGLAEIGSYDFDILDPSPEYCSQRGIDFHRAIAFGILEKGSDIQKGTFPLAIPDGDVSFVPVKDFQRQYQHSVNTFREADSEHLSRRFVICEPRGGLWKAFKKVRPSVFLTQEIPERGMISFSKEASQLMSVRAKESFKYFRSLLEEFSEFEVTGAVKIGIPTTNSDNVEHMWFEINKTTDNEIDCTLMNEPFYVDLEKGKQYVFGPEQLTDWLVATPAGMMTPYNSLPARYLRNHLDEIRESMRQETGPQ